MDPVICPCCGRPLPDGSSFCPFCGQPSGQPEAEEGSAETQAAACTDGDALSLHAAEPGGPQYDPVTPQQPDGGLSTAQYFWTLFLFAVPILGLVLMVYWSFGSTTCPARQRLARASLIQTGILGALAAVVLAFSLAMAASFGRSLVYAMGDYFYGGYGYYGGYYDGYNSYGAAPQRPFL